MTDVLIKIAIVFITFLLMEGVAWFTHKYIMHGLLWYLHKDHHKKETEGFLEKNDFFFLIFAIPGIICLFFGAQNGFSYVFFAGVGITLYGAAYFFVHDIFIHQRFKWMRNSNSIYFRALRRAHKMHHKHINKEHGECFGMLFVPFKYFREAKTQSQTS
ncbi:beta-carotene 3-hydroxylase [Filimonas zeae]|uniref:Beta-carotene hydroxylase n=1 Tax=Filimonas zeae TaxID=1737353 RepID=A0A917J0H2_9BACT|nr:sterol desaturase family protein [Filimonas zeae]MDR6338647.1 beta-carotene 3-hydroxylase [Filimonas zeae]GGH67232.1 beta-carotene hydroxylase [Filimonas zeae]